MQAPLLLRPLTSDEAADLRSLAQRRKTEARLRDRAQICWLAHQGRRVPQIAIELGVCEATVRRWITRFNTGGLAGLQDAGRSGRPPTYTTEEIGVVIATSLTNPADLDLPFASWTLDRLATFLQEVKGIAIKRSRISEVLQTEGLRWRTQETWFGERVDPAFAEKRGPSSPSTSSHQPDRSSCV
jgi:transposase